MLDVICTAHNLIKIQLLKNNQKYAIFLDSWYKIHINFVLTRSEVKTSIKNLDLLPINHFIETSFFILQLENCRMKEIFKNLF